MNNPGDSDYIDVLKKHYSLLKHMMFKLIPQVYLKQNHNDASNR